MYPSAIWGNTTWNISSNQKYSRIYVYPNKHLKIKFQYNNCIKTMSFNNKTI